MSDNYTNESMMDVFVYETERLLEQVEQWVIKCEKTSSFSPTAINEIFRIMHTIKGSSAMMLLNNIALLAHSVEDLFYYLRENKSEILDFSSLADIILNSMDFMKLEVLKAKNGDKVDGEASGIIESIKYYLDDLKSLNPDLSVKISDSRENVKPQYFIAPNRAALQGKSNFFKSTIYFEDGCEMENIRAFTVVHNLKEIAEEVFFYPEDIVENDDSAEIIKIEGFMLLVKTGKVIEELKDCLEQTIFLRELKLEQLESLETFENMVNSRGEKHKSNEGIAEDAKYVNASKKPSENDRTVESFHQSIISVNVSKLDKLMDLVGELVISEAMVTQNPDLIGLNNENFKKAARQLRKITGELQDVVMSIRMVSLAPIFHKMNRVVRDMCKKLNKEVELKTVGEETEVDKNIIEHISDPLMHLVRNAIDHGIESMEERASAEKSACATITIEAKNAGSEVLIIVKDDGRGLDREKILKKAMENGLVRKPESELLDREIFSFIFLPGFSTKNNITEFSGRGVGLDVVTKNISTVGGNVNVESTKGYGTTITMKIPLTLAIIDGMNIKVGNSCYTIPITAIKQSFRPCDRDVIIDPDGNELLMVRGHCYPILRLHSFYKTKTNITNISDGIIVIIDSEGRNLCIFADKLVGEQQVVVKTLPKYLKKVRGIAGCTLLGDGSISLILDIPELTMM